MAALQQRTKKNLTDQIRELIASSAAARFPLSRYQISKMTDIDEATLTRFMSGKRGLSAQAIDRLVDLFAISVETPTFFFLQQPSNCKPDRSDLPNPYYVVGRTDLMLILFTTSDRAINWCNRK